MPDAVLDLLRETAHAVATALAELPEWDEPGARTGQFACDVVADAAAYEVLSAAGVGVVSEERAADDRDGEANRDLVVIVDPVDGTENAVRGIPYFATSLCAVDADGPRAAVVVNLATGTRFEAVRGGGARCDGLPLQPGATTLLHEATVALCGPQRSSRPWRHMRAFGATALELCDVAQGVLDAYINTDDDFCAPWDYLGGVLICEEAGAAVGEGRGRPLATRDPRARRSPLVAATPPLLAAIAAYAWPRRPAVAAAGV